MDGKDYTFNRPRITKEKALRSACAYLSHPELPVARINIDVISDALFRDNPSIDFPSIRRTIA